ncbi:hypothetical protein BX285_6025 [Streptomyces sp. 1114.5]|uniref:hypothetical protein n=1 Tax=Streptomyces sp. 1114.5 TaxID=1938830 RepID=UPI000EB2A7CA|nr:hypothetical protein [Streptomyces sp. 1114.5]RKT12059.1 hypothetical protein BX285_6025 [Streptomyces sp. 1114.5]
MGDGRGMVPEVVEALLGGGQHRAVADVVRARLRMVPEGARALTQAEAGPQDVRARAQLTAAVAQLLAADEAFAQYLATTALGRPADPPTVHLRAEPPSTIQLRTGPPSAPTPSEKPQSTKSQSAQRPAGPTTVQLRVGPVDARARALAARRGSAGIVVALVLVLIAALVAVAVHLGSRPLMKPGGPGLAHAAQPLGDPAVAQGVLPDARAMPGGWQVQSGPESGTGSSGSVPCLLPDACERQLAYATVTFGAAPVQTVRFTAVTFASPDAAAQAFDTTRDRTAGEDSGAVALPSIGDQSAVRTRGSSSAVALVRVGGVLLLVHDDGLGAAVTAPGLTAFARLLADRARQAQDGRTPDATASSSTA